MCAIQTLNKIMHLENRHYLTKQTLLIESNSLKVESRDFMNSAEYEIPLEIIDNKKKIETSINHGLLTIAVMLFVIAILLLAGTNEELKIAFTFAATICALFAFVLKKRTITINVHDGTKIQLHFTNSNRDEVVAFCDAIINASNQLLINKFSKIDPRLPIDPQLENIQYLRNRGIISEENYDMLKDQLYGRPNKSYIGFGK
jgi:hypothetical protein